MVTEPNTTVGDRIDRPFTVSNDILSDGEALRARVEREGYLFLRGLIDTEAILATRREGRKKKKRRGR